MTTYAYRGNGSEGLCLTLEAEELVYEMRPQEVVEIKDAEIASKLDQMKGVRWSRIVDLPKVPELVDFDLTADELLNLWGAPSFPLEAPSLDSYVVWDESDTSGLAVEKIGVQRLGGKPFDYRDRLAFRRPRSMQHFRVRKAEDRMPLDSYWRPTGAEVEMHGNRGNLDSLQLQYRWTPVFDKPFACGLHIPNLEERLARTKLVAPDEGSMQLMTQGSYLVGHLDDAGRVILEHVECGRGTILLALSDERFNKRLAVGPYRGHTNL